MEEAERVEKPLVHGGVARDAQLVVVQLVVRALQVCLVPMTKIITELDTKPGG